MKMSCILCRVEELWTQQGKLNGSGLGIKDLTEINNRC